MKNTYKSIFNWLLIPAIAILLSGCITAAITAAAVATIDILHDRRTLGEYIDDNAVEVKARSYLVSKPELRSDAHVSVTAWNGIVLLTGEVADEQTKQQIVAEIDTYQGVRQVVDDSTITGKTALMSRANDTWITTKVKSRLLAKIGLDANRVKVVTERGNVYLMGIVSEAEADKATDLASKVRGVARVVRVFEFK